MTIAWIVAGVGLLAAGILAGLLYNAQARIRTLEHQQKSLDTDWRAKYERTQKVRDGLLSAVDDALLVLDSEQNILFANLAAVTMMGHAMAGQTLIAALRNPELETLISDARMLAGDSVERRVEIERRIVRARAVAIEDDSESFEVLTLRDVTELQQLERARREMVSNITHELSHPITAIGLLADTLLNVATKEKPKRIRKMAKDIRREADTLTQLVQEMRDLSLIESGQMPIRLMPTELQSVIEATIDQLRALVDNKNQTVELAMTGDLTVLADDLQIQRALKNILHNAIKFSPENDKIDITVTQDDDEAIIAIKDNGPGIPEEDLQRIFERFFQVDRARRDGTGLGLAIVRHIVRAHGGRTWAKSTEGHGATFYIALALADNINGSRPNEDDEE